MNEIEFRKTRPDDSLDARRFITHD